MLKSPTSVESKRRARKRGTQNRASNLSPRLGIIGGGQLARMLSAAAAELGCDVIVLERMRSCPAAQAATRVLVGNPNDFDALSRLAEQVDVVTLENEFVDAGLLHRLEQAGHQLFPSAQTLETIQDKFLQKRRLFELGVPVPQMSPVDQPHELAAAAERFGFPMVLKARRNGYDGKGNVTLNSSDDFDSAWQRLGGMEGNSLFVEAWCDFEAELAVVVTRGCDGETVVYPVAETVQRQHVCTIVRAPARFSDEILRQAAALALRAVEAFGAVGTFAVEMFLLRDGRIQVNELAPRVHNSGHFTIEACSCSQFENHVRAVLQWPLGSTRMLVPAAVMVNILGSVSGPARPAGLERALKVPDVHLHLYGKSRSEIRRKMGHVTALGDTIAQAESAALRAAEEIRFNL